MPGFIPLSTFKDFYTSTADLLQPEGFENFKKKLQSEEIRNFVLMKGISPEDFSSFLKATKEPGSILFYEWVESDPSLLQTLKGDVGKHRFVDSKSILKHRYISDFKVFLSPFLADVLLTAAAEKAEERRNAMSFIVLLDDDHRIVVEDQYFQPIKEKLRAIEERAGDYEEEQQLIDMVKPLCSDEIIEMINLLSKSSYASKLYYVDTLLGVIKRKACTARFANWILKQMERVQLNKEHEYKITDLKHDLREGRLTVKNKGNKRSPVRRRDIITWSIVIILGASVFYLIYFQPFNELGGDNFEKNSSFKKFTKEERMHLDSLIGTMNTNKDEGEIEIDPGYASVNTGPMLTIRKEFENELMEDIYNDLSKDAYLQKMHVDSCTLIQTSFIRYSGVKDLGARSAKVPSIFRNNSDYDAILYVAENKPGGDVFSILIEKDEQVEVELKTGDVITLIYGKHFTKYQAPSNAGGSVLPSSRFKHHFCDTDVNYEESINMSFRYEDRTRTSTKFMISGSKGTYVELIDVYDVLDDYGS